MAEQDPIVCDSSDCTGNSQNSFCKMFGDEHRPSLIEHVGIQDVEAGSTTSVDSISAPKAKLGTLSGVYLPCMQNILGVILFLRLPWITAQAGIFLTILVILICVFSTLLTSLSLSAIATNGQIQAGGPYFVISRNLGVEVGGALGIIFYLGTTIAASLYALGSIEAIQSGFDLKDLFYFDTQVLALILMFILASTVSIGVKYVNASASAFFAVVILSIVCLLLGIILFGSGSFNGSLQNKDRIYNDNMESNYERDIATGRTPSFFSLLALFYPSVTGIMAGSNRSAVLANPGKSIPTGTIGAILSTTAIYIIVVWLFGSYISNEALKENKLIVTAVTWPHEVIVKIGIVMSSVGAGLQSLTGAPRLLAAIAQDETIPFLKFLIPTSPSAEPTMAIWITWFIASLPCLAGNIDFITPIVTMFFLMMYAGVNLSCFTLSILRAPGFRPSFKYFHWSLSLFGFVWCLCLAIVIGRYTALITICLCICLYLYIKSKGAVRDWGDAKQGLIYNVIVSSLKGFGENEDFHAKNWRPQILCIIETDNESNSVLHPHLINLSAQLKKGRGINTLLAVLDGSILDPHVYQRVKSIKLDLEQRVEDQETNSFVKVIASTTDKYETILTAISSSGIGKLTTNTVLMAWPDKNFGHTKTSFFGILKGIVSLGKSIMLFKGNDKYPRSIDRIKNGTIDVWWLVYDGGLLLLLSYLLSLHKVWRGKGTIIRVFVAKTRDEESSEVLKTAVENKLKCIRIRASVIIVDLSKFGIADEFMKEKSVGEELCENNVELQYVDNAGECQPNISLDDDKYDHLLRAKDFNTKLRSYSQEANLVVTNLPLMQAMTSPEEFVLYTETLGDGIDNILFIRGSGREVVTTYG